MGSGKDDCGVIAGSVFGVVCTVILCIFGIPLVLVGIAMVILGSDDVYTAGVIILVVSCLVTVGAIVMTILLCCGCCKRPQPQPAVVVQTTQVPIQQPPVIIQVPTPSYGIPQNSFVQAPPPPTMESQRLLEYQQQQAMPGGVMSRPPPFNPHFVNSSVPSAYPSAPPSYDDTVASAPYPQPYAYK